MPPKTVLIRIGIFPQCKTCRTTYIFNGTGAINLKTLPNSTIHQLLYADWGNFGFNGTYSYAGTNTGWGGSWALDSKLGNRICRDCEYWRGLERLYEARTEPLGGYRDGSKSHERQIHLGIPNNRP